MLLLSNYNILFVNAVSVLHCVSKCSFPFTSFLKTPDPNPVARLTPLMDATNVKLSWERPPGRVDMYRLVWYQAESDPVSQASLNSQDDRKKRQSDQPQRRSVVVNGDSNETNIDTLFPGTLYVIEMTSISYGVESNKTLLTLRTRNIYAKNIFTRDDPNLNIFSFYNAVPLITSDIVIVKRHETNSLTLSYTPTPSSISRFSSYRFSLTDITKKTNVKEKTVDDPDRKVIFDDLIPGRLYEISGITGNRYKDQFKLFYLFYFIENFSVDRVGWSYISRSPPSSSAISGTGICYQCQGY